MKIRKATKKDIKEIVDLFIEESSKKPYNEKWAKGKALKEVKEFLEDELYVAVIEKKIIGFIASNINNDDRKKAYIRELWLRPEHYRKGIGRQLVKLIEGLYKKKGVKLIRLVTKKKAQAFKFYKKIKYNQSKELVFMERKFR